MHKRYLLIIFIIINIGLFQCGKTDESLHMNPEETDLICIPLTGEIAKSTAELSGLTFYQDQLILLPQYPDRFSEGSFSALFRIPKEELLKFLDEGNPENKISPQKILFDEKEIPDRLPRFQGYEAIAFVGNRVFLTIEINLKQSMEALVIEGSISDDMRQITLDESTLDSIPMPTQTENHAYEALVPVKDKLLMIYEANGANLMTSPQMVEMDLKSGDLSLAPFINMEYRITDATDAGENGKFWVTNYFWPGDVFKLIPAPDPLASKSDPPLAFSDKMSVERLVELQYTENGIQLTDSKPIVLGSLSPDKSRNWEGLVRLDDLGFLTATDRFPETILAFVPHE